MDRPAQDRSAPRVQFGSRNRHHQPSRNYRSRQQQQHHYHHNPYQQQQQPQSHPQVLREQHDAPQEDISEQNDRRDSKDESRAQAAPPRRRFVRHRGVQRPPSSEPEPQESASTVQSESSESQLKRNTFECMICCDNIHRTQPIWYCESCYNIFHLKCAIEWCNKSIRSRNEALANAAYPSLGQTLDQAPSLGGGGGGGISHQASGSTDYASERASSVEWPCPACRVVLHSRPGRYKCFCGKVTRPEVSRHLTPHSCGQLCGRKRPNLDCPHSCNSICHPGKCQPCSLTCKKSCYCGKLLKEVKCSVEVASCEETCGKLLSCGEHVCTKTCHKGSCDQCTSILTLTCHCGAKTAQKACLDLGTSKKRAEKSFSCDKICDKQLDCGNHRCQERCHPGPECQSCPLLSVNIKSCPCGATPVKKSIINERKSCLDPVTTCSNKCNKLLICGPAKSRHRCQKKCHTGPCPPCKLKTIVKCNCTSSSRSIDCTQMFERIEIGDGQVQFKQVKYNFKCETRCNRPKNCVRHRCQNKCCDAIRDPTSRLHVCEQVCGKRLACGQHNCTETCHASQCGDCTNIGWEELTCHCGASVMYPPIPCGAKPPACNRPCRRAHNCGHPVKHECHDDTERCAPCTFFVKKECFCKADSKESVYCYLSGYSCGRTCKKKLACGQHNCQRVCHENTCETPNERGIILCKQLCSVPKFTCKHSCGLPCHGSMPCPSGPCRKLVEITCECGNRNEKIECYKNTADLDNRNKVAMLSLNRPNQEAVMIDLSKKAAPARGSDEKQPPRKLECDDLCTIYKRNKALAEALDISNPDLKPSGIFGQDALRLVREATAQDYKFVAATYNSLAKFIKSAKASEKKYIFMQFPPTDELRRGVIQELANHFNCTSECHGEDPELFVVVKAFKNKCIVPEFTIEQLLPVTD